MPMSSAPRYLPHYTVKDYMQWQGDWQLFDGLAIAMTPSPFGRHEQIVVNLIYELTANIHRHECDCRVYAGLDWIVSDDTVVRPDVMVVCGEQPERHLERAPEFVVEVLSLSTEKQDRAMKRQLYFEHGVAFYLIVDPITNAIEFLQSGDEDYHTQIDPDRITCTLPSGCRIAIARDLVLR